MKMKANEGWIQLRRDNPQGARKDPISIAQKLFRDWCQQEGVVVDALAGANLIARITAALIERDTGPDQ